LQVTIVTHEHDAIAGRNTEHGHEAHHRTERDYSPTRSNADRAADQREREREKDNGDQSWRLKIRLQQNQDGQQSHPGKTHQSAASRVLSFELPQCLGIVTRRERQGL